MKKTRNFLIILFIAVFLNACAYTETYLPTVPSPSDIRQNTILPTISSVDTDKYDNVEKQQYVANAGKINIFYPQLINMQDTEYQKIINDSLYVYAINEYFNKWDINNLYLKIDYTIHYLDSDFVSIEFYGEGHTNGSRINYIQYGVNLDLRVIDSVYYFHRMEISEITQIQSVYSAISNGDFQYLGVLDENALSLSGNDIASTFLVLSANEYNALNSFVFDETGIILFIDDRYPHSLKIEYGLIDNTLILK